MAVGLVLGFALQLVFEAAQFAGQVLGVQMGFSLVNVLDPQTQVDTPVLGIFCQLVTLLIFLRLQRPPLAVARSGAQFPIYSARRFPAELAHHRRDSFGPVAVSCYAACRSQRLPSATLLADIALGFLGKASPQLPGLFVGLSVKSVLGLTVLRSLARGPDTLSNSFW